MDGVNAGSSDPTFRSSALYRGPFGPLDSYSRSAVLCPVLAPFCVPTVVRLLYRRGGPAAVSAATLVIGSPAA